LILKQFYLPCLAHASYVIGDEQTGTGVVVDPQRDADQYIAFVAEHGLTIKYVFLTHLHADFVAGDDLPGGGGQGGVCVYSLS
jgi:hydroxyacylglutathione hydrolase